MILLPGIQAGPGEMAPLAAVFGPEARVIALPSSEADRLPAIAAELEATLPPGAHDFVAASFGALLVWALPPGRVRSLVAIGALPWRTAAAARSGRAGAVLPWLPEAFYRPLYQRRIRASLVADGASPALADAATPPPRRVLAARLRAIAAWNLPPRPPAPCAWLWGADDPWVTWTAAEVQARGLTPLVVPGRHRPHVERPEAVAAAIAAWRGGG